MDRRTVAIDISCDGNFCGKCEWLELEVPEAKRLFVCGLFENPLGKVKLYLHHGLPMRCNECLDGLTGSEITIQELASLLAAAKIYYRDTKDSDIDSATRKLQAVLNGCSRDEKIFIHRRIAGGLRKD